MFRLKTKNQQLETNIPMNPYLKDNEIKYITDGVLKFVK